MVKYQLKLDVDEFLCKHWQREHLFIPQGFEDFQAPADANELAGLAMEPGTDGRIVSNAGRNDWQQFPGPFTENSYERGGAWTLLVQSVDQYWDEAAELLRSVSFLPNWRLDDIMMSYATDNGSAGPHFDNYDVFIIQGSGQRRWQIGGRCDESSELLEASGLKLLANFKAGHEYLMNMGDVLYIPPGVAHYGISIGESTSFSIGFRAPRQSDLLARWTDNRLDDLGNHMLFEDSAREPATRSGEITTADLNRAREQLLRLFDAKDPRWFGETITNRGNTIDHSHAEATSAIENGTGCIFRVPGSRLAWHLSNKELLVFAQGGSQAVPTDLQTLVESLCDSQEVILDEALRSNSSAVQLLRWLYEEGVILVHE